ncbi:MAG TPA: metallophosphoesterase, partial [Burkholderiales bacterium]|nr:metallophosphoesterase [Burkholderiales bacterium]
MPVPTNRLISALLLAIAVALTSACASTATKREAVAVKIVAINDFHGNLDVPPEGLWVDDSEVPAGGTAHLATLIEGMRAQNRNFVFVSAGDLVGASPLLSATFDDEPTIEAMNALGLDFSAVGNHEFDRGLPHLNRLQQGGCPAGGCKSGKPFGGAHFP